MTVSCNIMPGKSLSLCEQVKSLTSMTNSDPYNSLPCSDLSCQIQGLVIWTRKVRHFTSSVWDVRAMEGCLLLLVQDVWILQQVERRYGVPPYCWEQVIHETGHNSHKLSIPRDPESGKSLQKKNSALKASQAWFVFGLKKVLLNYLVLVYPLCVHLLL